MVPHTPLALIPGVAVRFLHVLGMALAVGGAVFTWLLLRADDRPARWRQRRALRVASGYEWLFWAAVGVLVMTGVGNLGALAPSLPRGGWALTLQVKLLAVLVVLAGSVLRTLVVWRYRGTRTRLPTAPLRRAYGATALALVAVVALAEVLAHG